MMDYIKRNLKDLMVYASWWLVIFLLALYMGFPYEKILSGYVTRLERQYNLSLKVEKLSPSLPLGIKGENIAFSAVYLTGGKTIKVDSLKIKTSVFGALLWPFTRFLPIYFRAGFDGGNLEGSIASKKDSSDMKLSAKGLELESISPLFSGKGFFLSGKLDADVVSSTKKAPLARFDLLGGRGELNFKAQNIQIQKAQEENSPNADSEGAMTPLSLFLPLSFSKLDGKIVLNNGVIEIKELNIAREGLSGKIDGAIRLASDLHNAVLDLDFNLKFAEDEELYRGLIVMYGISLGCPMGADGRISCKLKGSIRDLISPY